MSKKLDFQFKQYDDCDWQTIYPAAHAKQTQDIINQGISMELSDFTIASGVLKCNNKIHPNQLLLYKFMYYLQPHSVFEVGFGYVNHLLSIYKVCPKTRISGCDIALAQYENACKIYPDIPDCKFDLYIQDFCNWNYTETYDVIFSNAVLMHMSSNRALQCVYNMVNISNEWVIILDGGLMVPQEMINQINAKDVFYFTDFADKYWDYYTPPIFINKHKMVDRDLLYKIFKEVEEEAI